MNLNFAIFVLDKSHMKKLSFETLTDVQMIAKIFSIVLHPVKSIKQMRPFTGKIKLPD